VPITLDVTVSGTEEPGPRYAQVEAPVAVQNGPAPAARTVIAPAGWVAIGAAALVVLGLVVAIVARRRRGA
jgi:Ca-activated chloride channel homolog